MLNRTTMLTYYLHCLELLIKEQTPNQATSGLIQGLPDHTPDPILYSSRLVLTSRCSHTVHRELLCIQGLRSSPTNPGERITSVCTKYGEHLLSRFALKCPALPPSIRKGTPRGVWMISLAALRGGGCLHTVATGADCAW
jgi:hypothetical protein